MRPRKGVSVIGAVVFVVLGVSTTEAQTCDQTISVGADVAAAVASAPNDSTICLNDGDYGTVNITNIDRNGFVTVRSTTGQGAQLGIGEVWASSFIKFESLTFDWATVRNGSHHIEFWNSTFAPGGDGLIFNLETVPATDTAFIVDGCVFDQVSHGPWDGRMSVRGVRGLKIRNSVFSGSPAAPTATSDGIMLIGGARDVEVGPGNVFTNIRQQDAHDGEHIDAFQIFGAGPNNKVIGNYFTNSDTFIMAPDGSDSVTVENNVFDGAALPYEFKIQFGSTQNSVFRHNTVRDVVVSFDSKPTDPASSNILAENNILVGASSWKTSSGNGCSNCTFTSNLFDDSADASGTNNVIGVPTFVGGASPTSYEGWLLAEGSIGENAGNDGLDMGITGGSTPPPPPPPTPETVVRGETVMSFDHDGEFTDSYELCWETETGVSCVVITVTPVEGTNEKRFVLPESVPLGPEVVMGIVAVGPSGRTSGPTSVYEVTDPAPPPPPAPSAPSAPRVVS